MSYIGFKEKLWNKIIKKSKPAREQCFLKGAFERANKGDSLLIQFVNRKFWYDEIKSDGILGYESPHGYFITHDIYEMGFRETY